MTQIDVFTVTYNHASTLAATLEGVAAQSHPVARVVIVDNASTDGSAEVGEGFRHRLPLEVVRNERNLGFSAAANAAMRLSSSPWVLSLNPDCRLNPTYLERLVDAASSHGAGSATGLLLRAHGAALTAGTEVDSAGMVVHASGRHLDRGAAGRLTEGLARPAWVFGASGAAALLRRDALTDVAYPGGEVFDEGFFAYREDADLAWRLQRRGWGCLYWPAARAFHSRGLKPEVRRRGTPEINLHSVRNRFLLRWANADWRWRLACFPWWLLRDAVVAAACLTVERSSLPSLEGAWRMREEYRARGRWNRARARHRWRTVGWFLPGGRERRVPA